MRWLITFAIVLALAAAALSAPWWLPALLAPFLGDPVLVESAMTLAQLVLWVMAGLAAVVGIRWALKPRGSSYKVMDADELEAAVAQAATEDEAASEAAKEQVQEATEEGEVEAQAAAEGTEEVKVGSVLSDSLFGRHLLPGCERTVRSINGTRRVLGSPFRHLLNHVSCRRIGYIQLFS